MNGTRRTTATDVKSENPSEALVGNRRVGTDADEARPPAFTDEALALRFAEQHAGSLRYVEVWGRWLTWDGTCWQFDDTLAAYDRVRETCRKASAECNTEKLAAALAPPRWPRSSDWSDLIV